jgi:hypothetical protein
MALRSFLSSVVALAAEQATRAENTRLKAELKLVYHNLAEVEAQRDHLAAELAAAGQRALERMDK